MFVVYRMNTGIVERARAHRGRYRAALSASRALLRADRPFVHSLITRFTRIDFKLFD